MKAISPQAICPINKFFEPKQLSLGLIVNPTYRENDQNNLDSQFQLTPLISCSSLCRNKTENQWMEINIYYINTLWGGE